MSVQVSVVVIAKEDRVVREGQQVWRIWSRLRPEERDMTILTCAGGPFGCGAAILGLRIPHPRVHFEWQIRSQEERLLIGIAIHRRRFVDAVDYQSAPAARELCCSIVGAAAASSGRRGRATNTKKRRIQNTLRQWAERLEGVQFTGREKRNCRQSRDRWSCELALVHFCG